MSQQDAILRHSDTNSISLMISSGGMGFRLGIFTSGSGGKILDVRILPS
jgi:hypothetical protein